MPSREASCYECTSRPNFSVSDEVWDVWGDRLCECGVARANHLTGHPHGATHCKGFVVQLQLTTADIIMGLQEIRSDLETH